ncbi:MAG TPA: membrane protein insertion efficiency factor YidD [Candidatus Competibacteraceae bacterium]|nr:membrane protein insertion efficiency factor YidD [Candidatus Competibacteraceae bacterium]
MRKFLIFLVRAYQWLLSPFLGYHCRFYPTCSQYAVIAIERHGPVRGVWLALKRVLRCHPWHPGGIDLVPDVSKKGR